MPSGWKMPSMPCSSLLAARCRFLPLPPAAARLRSPFGDPATYDLLALVDAKELQVATPAPQEIVTFPEPMPVSISVVAGVPVGGARVTGHVVRPDGSDRQDVARFDWDVMWAYLSRSGERLVVAVNEDSRTRLHLYDAATLEELELPEMGEAQVTSVRFSRDETMISFFASTDRTPGDPHRGDQAHVG